MPAMTFHRSACYRRHSHVDRTLNVEVYDAAVGETDSLTELVNRTWERRGEITPDYETRERAVDDGLSAATANQL